jgi:hypothetical protein
MTDTTQRQVRAVFANYKVKTATGVGLKTAPRGAFIDTASLADGELERLERNGALMSQGREVDADRLEETLARALNPLDVAPIDYGAPPDVAAPPLGAVPRGEHTTGRHGGRPGRPAAAAGHGHGHARPGHVRGDGGAGAPSLGGRERAAHRRAGRGGHGRAVGVHQATSA